MSKKFGANSAHMLFGKIDDMLERVSFGIEKARDYLFTQQHEDGYWCGELEADTTLESDYIAIHTLLGTGNPSRMERAIPEILRHQNADGGWPIFAGGPSNISASVKAYFALKLMGYKPEHPAPSATPLPRFICASWANMTGRLFLQFRRRSCFSQTGSGSTCMRFRRGRAQFWCRCPLPMPRNHSRKFRQKWESMSCLWADAMASTCTSSGPRKRFPGETFS